MKPLSGCFVYKNKQVSINAKIFKIKSGQECYLSGISKTKNGFVAILYVFDLDKFVERPFCEIEKYL
jgi:hypothetical protein